MQEIKRERELKEHHTLQREALMSEADRAERREVIARLQRQEAERQARLLSVLRVRAAALEREWEDAA